MAERPKMKGEGIVFKYGALKPTSGHDLVREQFWRAHRYRNKLCELERNRREAVHAALSELCPELAVVKERLGHKARDADPESGSPAEPATGIEGEIEAATALVKARRARRQSRSPDQEGKRVLGDLRRQRRELWAEKKRLETELYDRPEWKERDQALWEEHSAQTKRARSESGVYWGTYLQVENAAKSMAKGTPPEFRRWSERKDKLAVQFQGGLSVSELLSGEDRRAKLTVYRRPNAEPGSKRGETLLHGVLCMRVGSNGRDPVWATIPITYHRSIPVHAKIKWLFLIRSSVGQKDRWSVQFVCESESWAKPDLAVGGSVGIDVGWRIFPDRLRVAVWAGSDGEEGELALPNWWIQESRKERGIRSERDRLLDEIRPRVSEWAGENDRPWIAQTRSHRRIERLVYEARRDGLLVPEEIEAWRKRERHLYEYEAHLRDQLQGSRRDLYRRFAARITRDYAKVVLEDLDLRYYHVRPNVEDGETVRDDVLKAYVRDACLSGLIDALKQRAREVELVNPDGTTYVCHACGDDEWKNVEVRDALHHECSACGLEWDQDVNAARNILAFGSSGEAPNWSREPLAPSDVMTYPPGMGNKAQRRAARNRALEMERVNIEGAVA